MPEQRLHAHRLCLDYLPHPVVWRVQAAFACERREHRRVIQPHEARVIFLRTEGVPRGRKHLLERTEMQRFAVHDHAVEVEDDPLQHASG